MYQLTNTKFAQFAQSDARADTTFHGSQSASLSHPGLGLSQAGSQANKGAAKPLCVKIVANVCLLIMGAVRG
jgi:hypothetical protein